MTIIHTKKYKGAYILELYTLQNYWKNIPPIG